MPLRPLIPAIIALALAGCNLTEPPRVMRPQTVALIATPKMIADFANPGPSVASFLAHYEPLIARAARTIVIFAVGNSQHILTYRGAQYWDDSAEWARLTNGAVVSDRVLTYAQIAAIVAEFRAQAAALQVTLSVFDQVDQTIEFTFEDFKLGRHPECTDFAFEASFNIRGRLVADTFTYASAPDGIPQGKLCGEFLADQVALYMRDLGFDGILYGNQLGTRGRWQEDRGPGYSDDEATAIRQFYRYSERAYGERDIIWFDSYNNVRVERNNYSVPIDAYESFDYIIAAGFCVITFPARYYDNLRSKIQLTDRTRVLATLDYLDPWYDYVSMTDFAEESRNLEEMAIRHRYDIDGIVFFSHGHDGHFVPADRVQAFADRFFEQNTN